MSAVEQAGVPVTRIEARRGIVPLHLRDLWEYRELALFFVLRDIKGRYRQMALGPLWIMISPLISVALCTIIFNKIAKLGGDGVPYPIFNYTGLLIWGVFASVLTGTAASLLSGRNTISKVYFPRFIMPLVEVFAAVFNFLISLVVLAILMVRYDVSPSLNLLALPLYLLLAVTLGLGVGFWWSSWIVHFRDLSTVLNYLLKGWMYATPIVYPLSTVPEKWQGLYLLNPTVALIQGFRWSVLGVGSFDGGALLRAFAVAAVFLVAGAYYFRMTERSIVDIA